MNIPKTLQQAIQFFTKEENCREFMIAIRWDDGKVRCPHCDSDRVSYLEKSKLYFCPVKHPRQKFSLKVGTVMEDSPIGLDKWLPVMWMMVNCKNGISSYEVARAIGITQKSAWFMLHRIRLAVRNGFQGKLGGPEGGPVEVDETFVGGKIKNMHRAVARKRFQGVPARGHQQKAIVMGMRDRETRQVRAKVIPNVKRETLQSEILAQVEQKSTVYTDAASGYYNLAQKNFIHDTVNHMEEYVRGEVHTQGIENFWSCLKRSLSGTYVAVEPFHLDRYLDEQMFRYNNRTTRDNPLNDADRFMLAVSLISGKRLTYAELTGKVGETSAEPF
jgi:transposase-like protein